MPRKKQSPAQRPLDFGEGYPLKARRKRPHVAREYRETMRGDIADELVRGLRHGAQQRALGYE